MIENLSQIISEVKNIKIFSKRMSAEAIYGGYQSAFRGAGLELRQIREYAFGDDVRSIAWSASAKIGRMMVKEFTGERDRALVVVPCLGPSMNFSSTDLSKAAVAVKLSAMLGVLAEFSGDRFGYVLPVDKIIFSSPKKGMANLVGFLSKVSSQESDNWSIKRSLEFLIDAKFRNNLVFLISDWIEPIEEDSIRLLKVLSRKQEVTIVRILDSTERKLPNVGLLSVSTDSLDSNVIIDTSLSHVNEILLQRLRDQDSIFRSTGIKLLDITPGESIDRKLAEHFRLGSIYGR